MPSKRIFGISLGFGLLHTVGLVAVGVHLGYSVGLSAYSPLSLAWRYGGLLVVAAMPMWLALRYRLVVPLVALMITTGYVLGMELTPPGPTFRDVAELERLAEPTGITIVENGLYIVRYMVNASVWTVGFLYTGLVEYVLRNEWDVLPTMQESIQLLSIPASRDRAIAVATAGGLLHAAVMTGFAYRLGVGLTGGFELLLYVFGAAGMWILATVPLYLLFRHRLIGPIFVLTLFILSDVQAEFTTSVEDPHALYFGGWFFYLGILLLVSGVEYGLRRLTAPRESASSG